jgi:hypothetical protein
MSWFRRRGESNDMISPAANTDRITSAERELSVSQRRLASVPELEKRLENLGVTPDEYGRALVRGYLTRRSA